MSARASGADARTNGNAKHRTHNDGSSERPYTVEQKTAVIRVRRCSPTAFYDILGLEEIRKTVSDGDIKKAYRKLSLLTHPDKNGYQGADEAFKSKFWCVLFVFWRIGLDCVCATVGLSGLSMLAVSTADGRGDYWKITVPR